MSQNTLELICARKREHIAQRKKIKTESLLQSEITGATRGFLNALKTKSQKNEFALIAEIKKASPSRGVIRQDFNPEKLAREYEEGGATCISVLTDEPYFQGRDEYLQLVRNTVQLPLLRKDFMLDPYQVTESRALGADCILLIMAAVSDDEAVQIEKKALSLNLDVLIEIHNKQELDRALKLSSSLIGINNRDLKTLKVDLSVSERLYSYIPKGYTVVCESGINKNEHLQQMNNIGISCFLVGEALMIQDDVGLATKNLLGIE